jgi:hypothetical protein
MTEGPRIVSRNLLERLKSNVFAETLPQSHLDLHGRLYREIVILDNGMSDHIVNGSSELLNFDRVQAP